MTYKIATFLDRLGTRNDNKEVLDFARTVVAYCIWLLAICQEVQSTFFEIATFLDRLGTRNDNKEVLDFARTVVKYCYDERSPSPVIFLESKG